MSASNFDEWLAENNVESWSAEDFARLAWDAAIKSDAIALCQWIASADYQNINVTEASGWVRQAKRLLAQQHT